MDNRDCEALTAVTVVQSLFLRGMAALSVVQQFKLSWISRPGGGLRAALRSANESSAKFAWTADHE